MADDNAATKATLLGTATAAAASLLYLQTFGEKPVPLPIDRDLPDVPAPMKIVASLPRFLRDRLSLANAAPKGPPPKDGCDVLGGDGKYDPYDYKELVEGKLWRVRYKTLKDFGMYGFFKMCGLDFLGEGTVERAPEAVRALLREDQKIIGELMAKAKEEGGGRALLEAGLENSQDMIVARLEGPERNGRELMIFNPCRMRPAVMKWLRELGDVAYIVSGSGYHTNHLPLTGKAYPDAKLVCAGIADAKLSAAGARRADYIYTDPQSLGRLNEALKGSGVSVHPIGGDPLQCALVSAHRHLLEADVAYGHPDGRWAACDLDSFKEGQSPNDSDMRLFYYGSMHGDASPNGILPVHRYMMLDPTHPLGKMQLAPPRPDGSSCAEIAESLRSALKMDFVAVNMAHSTRREPMPAEEFRKCVDAAWRWLDGRSLLDSE